MPSHAERVRRHYACPSCDGDRTNDEGGPCWRCHGDGVVLTPDAPPRRLTAAERALVDAMRPTLDALMATVVKNLGLVERSYDERPLTPGATIIVRTPLSFQSSQESGHAD